MKNADNIRARFGANIVESMGGEPTGAGGGLPTGILPKASSQYDGTGRIRDALAIEVERIEPDPDQPRQEFDEEALDRLAASMKARGQLQPCRVRWDADRQTWVIIAGERRWRAARRAGLKTLMCIEARGPATAEDLLEDQLVENCVREDLRPIEQAHAYRTLMQRRGWSYAELAEFLHISKGTIAKALALLDLPEAVQDLVEHGDLAPKAAYEIRRLDDPAEQLKLAQQVVTEGLTVEEATAQVQSRQSASQSQGQGQGRGGTSNQGKGKPRAVKKRAFKIPGGKVTIERAKGIDEDTLRAAAEAILAQIEPAHNPASEGPEETPSDLAA